jgi:hypothetical protein
MLFFGFLPLMFIDNSLISVKLNNEFGIVSTKTSMNVGTVKGWILHNMYCYRELSVHF